MGASRGVKLEQFPTQARHPMKCVVSDGRLALAQMGARRTNPPSRRVGPRHPRSIRCPRHGAFARGRCTHAGCPACRADHESAACHRRSCTNPSVRSAGQRGKRLRFPPEGARRDSDQNSPVFERSGPSCIDRADPSSAEHPTRMRRQTDEVQFHGRFAPPPSPHAEDYSGFPPIVQAESALAAAMGNRGSGGVRGRFCR